MGGTLYSRIVNKHDTEANWDALTAFVPLAGEIILYDTDEGEKMKVGDGTTLLADLPFLNEIITDMQVDTICGQTIYQSSEVKF